MRNAAILIAISILAVLPIHPGAARTDRQAELTPALLVCEHGSVKSLIAATLFNRAAEQRGLPYRAISRGVTPDAGVPARIVAALRDEGVDIGDYVPQQLTAQDVARASRVVAIGVDLASFDIPGVKPIETWNDVPPASVDYQAARTVLLGHIDRLLDEWQATGSRPSAWAQPVAATGAPNLHKVSDALFRSAQPTAEGFRNLKELGIVTVVNLRSFNSDRKEIGTTGLAYEHLYMKAWHPERKEVVRFLQIVTDPKRTPVLVHCQHGADRTGTMSAVYRIVVEGWSKEDALREMQDGGFGFHRIWSNLPDWINKLDVEGIQKEIGLEPVAP